MVSRRRAIASIGAVAVVGFHSTARAWVSGGRAISSARFRRIPALEGRLLTAPASVAPYATDAGNSVHETPNAVLVPGSVQDIQKMVRFCQCNGISVGARGQGHTTFGQSQVSGGLVIDMSPLDAVDSMGAQSASVQAGLKWNALVTQTSTAGLRPPTLTGYLGLSIGGTLSVGGISSTYREGAQVDRVQDLDVVTGDGDLVNCSASRNRDLFEMALGGLGQCGIITRATIDLVAAPSFARVYTVNYADNAAFFSDVRTLLARGELDELYNFGLPDGAGGWVYQLTAAKLFNAESPPNDPHLFRSLSVPATSVTATDVPFLSHVRQVDGIIESLKQTGLWDQVQHPWFDVFLPDRSVERYLGEVMPTLAPEDVGPTGFLLLFPHRRAKFTRPLLRVPECDEWVYLFDILTAGPSPGEDSAFQSRMLARNRRLFDKARCAGGTRYPIGTVAFERSDWVAHYAEEWPRLARLKRAFDPANILTPGPGIFT